MTINFRNIIRYFVKIFVVVNIILTVLFLGYEMFILNGYLTKETEEMEKFLLLNMLLIWLIYEEK